MYMFVTINEGVYIKNIFCTPKVLHVVATASNWSAKDRDGPSSGSSSVASSGVEVACGSGQNNRSHAFLEVSELDVNLKLS